MITEGGTEGEKINKNVENQRSEVLAARIKNANTERDL